jgi:hypothetical protein
MCAVSVTASQGWPIEVRMPRRGRARAARVKLKHPVHAAYQARYPT